MMFFTADQEMMSYAAEPEMMCSRVDQATTS